MNFHDPKQQLGELHGDLKDKEAKGAGHTTDIALPKGFWKRPLGRTLRGKNKTGKILYSVAGVVVSAATGVNIEALTGLITNTQTGLAMEAILDFNLYQLIVVAVAMLIMWGLPSAFPAIEQRSAWKLISGRLDDVADSIVKAMDEDSEGGKKITRQEWKQIVSDALKSGKDD